MNETEKFVIDRLDRIELKIDKLLQHINHRLVPLEKFKSRVMGIVTFIMCSAPVVAAIAAAKIFFI